MTDRIEANYEVLEQIVNKFAALHDQAATMQQSLLNAHQQLQATWTGDAFDKYDAEATSVQEPATKRLVEAMQRASEVTKQLAHVFHNADEECSGGFQITI